MAIDCLGGVFSVLSLIFKQQVEIFAAIVYALDILRPPGSVSCDAFTLMSVRLHDRTGLRCFVLVLDMILNPCTKRVAQRREQNSRDGVGDIDVGDGHHAFQ